MQVCGGLPGRSASEDAPSLGTVRGKARAGRHWQDRCGDKQPQRGQYTTSCSAAGNRGILFFVFFIVIFFVVTSLIVVIIFFLIFLLFSLFVFLLVFLFLVSLFVFMLYGGRPDSSGGVLLPCVFPAPAPGRIPRERFGGHLLPGLR